MCTVDAHDKKRFEPALLHTRTQMVIGIRSQDRDWFPWMAVV
jgi:hypothetical protein